MGRKSWTPIVRPEMEVISEKEVKKVKKRKKSKK